MRAKIADYCARYRVSASGAQGLPPFPAGKRETRQHREWIVLYKAVHRMLRRQQTEDPLVLAAALKAQKGRCPVCLEPVDAAGATSIGREGARPLVVDRACGALVRLVQRLGPGALDRLRSAAFSRDVKSEA